MRAVLVCDRASAIRHEEQLLAALRRVVADAEVYEQSGDRTVRLAGYDLVISTSLRAGTRLILPEGTAHFCFVCTVPKSIDWSATGGITQFLAGTPTAATALNQGSGRSCSVLELPVNTAFFRPEKCPRDAFYLMVRETWTADDVELAIQACRLANRELTIVGAIPASVAASLRSTVGILCVGKQSEEMLRHYYLRCRAVIVSGSCDLDTTAIEAQACGTPVIAWQHGSAAGKIIDAEGTGPGTGLFYDEPTPASLLSAMSELERRPHKCQPGLALANAARFSIGQFGRELLALLADQPSPERCSVAGRSSVQSTRPKRRTAA